jgi:lipocalin
MSVRIALYVAAKIALKVCKPERKRLYSQARLCQVVASSDQEMFADVRKSGFIIYLDQFLSFVCCIPIGLSITDLQR